MAKEDPILWLGADLPLDDAPRIPTGFYLLDHLILDGGIQMGMIAEVVSREGGGKTLFCIRVAGSAQRMGYKVAWADAEYYLKSGVPQWFAKHGCRLVDMFIYGRRERGHATLEETYSISEKLLRASKDNPHKFPGGREAWADVIVIDSLAALQPKAITDALEAGKDLDDAITQIGKSAIMTGAFLSHLSEVAVQERKLVLCCNQVRSDFGKTSWAAGPQFKPYGGQEIAHRLDLRLLLSPAAEPKIRRGDSVVGQRSRLRVFKNRVGTNYLSTGKQVPDLQFYFDGTSLTSEMEIVEAALFYGVVQRKGSWYSFGEDRVRVQGKPKLLETLKNEGLLDTVEAIVAAKTAKSDQPAVEEVPADTTGEESEVDNLDWLRDDPALTEADAEDVL